MFEYLIYFGRFQPPHRGHIGVIEAALRQAECLIMFCQGVDLPRSIQRPWTFEERVEMINAALGDQELTRVRILPAADNRYRPRQWAASIAEILNAVLQTEDCITSSARIGILGTGVDDRERMRQLFPRWQWVEVEPLANCDSAEIRARILGTVDSGEQELEHWLSPAVLKLLRATTAAAAFAELRAEFEANEAFRALWATAPWPPVFVTVDAVVVAQGHVLLVERAHRPGKGLWALPGGFLGAHETLAAACIRELREETKIEVDEAALIESIRLSEVFDDPARSARGRTITHAHLIDLSHLGELPQVEGGDDAHRAQWFPLGNIRRNQLFEDHFAILQAMLGIE